MIREFTEEDLDQLFELGLAVNGPYKDPDKAKYWMKKLATRNDYRAFIFVEGDTFLGFVACKVQEEMPPVDLKSHLDSCGHIAKIGVHESVRGKGIGRRLLVCGEEWLRSKGLSGSWLGYMPNGTREKLYREYEVLAEYQDERNRTHRVARKKW